MDIFELAIAKKLFGGGGGKREGTAIKAGKIEPYVFFNLSNTKEETNAIFSQLTFVETPLLPYPLYAVYASTTDGNSGYFLIVVKMGASDYAVTLIRNIATSLSGTFYSSTVDSMHYNGWAPSAVDLTSIDAGIAVAGGILMGVDGISLTDFSGIPVGMENEKIKNVLSSTPF